MAKRCWVLALLLSLVGCDEEEMLRMPGDRDAALGTDAGPEVDAGTPPETDAGPMDPGPGDCDYRAVDGRVIIEAENLPLDESWREASDEAGFSGSGYIEWTGSSHNNDPSNGNMAVDVYFDAAGRYELQIHQRVGRGDNPTEHNDIWVRVADADGFYGRRGDMDDEQRVYPDPQCEDSAFTAPILALPNVSEVDCPNGSSRDGWFKVYSSGALDWRWIARTSDNDAHSVIVEMDAPGTVTFEIGARADWAQLDRIVLHEISQEDDVVRDFGLAETTCE